MHFICCCLSVKKGGLIKNKIMNLGKFDCSTGLINVLYNDPLKDKALLNYQFELYYL